MNPDIALLHMIELDILNDYEVLKEKEIKSDTSRIQDKSLRCMFLNKHANGKKLSSHLWFFSGFCPMFRPTYCCLIDTGTEPSEDGLVKFY